MEIIKYLKKELIKPNLHCRNQKEVFNIIYEEAFKNDYVKEEFLERIIDREKSYPTGIELSNYSVAIPHTDAELINEQFISIAVLREPVSFNLMDDGTKETNVNIVFLLGLNKPENQLSILQEIIKLIQNEDIIREILESKYEDKILEVLGQRR